MYMNGKQGHINTLINVFYLEYQICKNNII